MSSLKRSADGSEFDLALSSKRAALGASTGGVSTGTPSYLLKMLCPNTAIGSIIGKGGSVINQLNQKTGARIKLSQNQDFFPMTNDRVISISGDQASIGVAIAELITKIMEVPDKKSPDTDMYGNMTHNQTPPPNRALQVRILIPMGASGVMIGRQGSVIKSMSEQSSCHMQLAEMNDPYDTKERIMIINGKNGSLEDLIKGARLALAQLLTDATLCVYTNVRISYPQAEQSMEQARMPINAPNGGREVHVNQAMYQQPGYNQNPMMTGYGFDPRSQPPSMQAQQYNQQPQQFSGHSMYHQGQVQRAVYPADMHGQGQKGMGPGVGHGQGQGRPQHTYQAQGQQQALYSPEYGNNQAALSEINPPIFSADGASITMTLGVPDNLVGAILGRSGCVVKEIMSLSGTQIQISQKDLNQGSGDKFRQVKVVGLQHQVLVAQSMIMAKMHSQPPSGR